MQKELPNENILNKSLFDAEVLRKIMTKGTV